LKAKRQVIATSGGFAIEPRNRRIDKYILSQAIAEKPKICFIGTASGDSKHYIERFYKFFAKENCTPNHLPLFKGTMVDVESFILSQDILYVGGGNSRNMFAIWKDRGIDQLLRKAYEKGVVMSGISAGSLCWFEEGMTDSIPGRLTSMPCLGLVKGSNCPFFNEDKRKTYTDFISQEKIKPGLANEIGVGIHFENETMKNVVTSRKDAKAYKFTIVGNEIHEEVMFPEYLELKRGKLKKYNH